MEFLDWIQNLGLVTWVREAPTVLAYPTVLAVHTFGLIFLVGPNVAMDLRILGFAPQLPLAPMERFFRVMWTGFWVNAASGLLLWALAPVTFLTTPVFYIKMAAVWLGAINLRVLRRRVFRNRANLGAGPVSKEGKTSAIVSLALWTIAIFSGRVSAYFPFVQRQTAIAVVILIGVAILLAKLFGLRLGWSSHVEPLRHTK